MVKSTGCPYRGLGSVPNTHRGPQHIYFKRKIKVQSMYSLLLCAFCKTKEEENDLSESSPGVLICKQSDERGPGESEAYA